MRVLLAEQLEVAVHATRDSRLADDLAYMLDELGRTDGIAPADSCAAAHVIALTPRGDGLLVTLLDERERPVQMLPLRADLLDPHLDLYGATIERMSEIGGSFEALDYGKRIAHNEAAEAMQTMLAPVLTVELEAARRIFSLVFLLLRRLGAQT